MRIADIQEFDVNNGEGVGCSLFVQGCHFHCKNCFNQSTWDFNGGEEWTQSTKEKFLELVNRPYITRVSILGGEPLADENVIEIYSLVSRIKNECNKKIWLYTGYTWEYLVKENRLTQGRSFNDFYDSDNKRQLFKIVHRSLIIPFIDVLVDGQYIDELRDINLPFRGSSNQRLIDVKKTLNSFTIGDNRIVEYKIN